MNNLIGTGFQPGFLPEPQWRDENFDPLAVTIPGNNDAPIAMNVSGTDLFVASFPVGATTEVPISGKEVNHDWIPGTDIVAHAHVIKTSALSGNFELGLEYKVVEGTTTPVYGTLTASKAVPLAAWSDETRLDLGSIDMSTFTGLGAQITFRLFRDPSVLGDTYNGSIAVLSFGWHYQVNSSGSRTIGAK